MGFFLKLRKGDELVFSRGSCSGSCTLLGQKLEANGYALEVYVDRPQGNIKEFAEFVKEVFAKEPERVLRFEEVILDYLRSIVESERKNVRTTISKVLNRLRNITGSPIVMLLEPFVIIRASSILQSDKRLPYVQPKKEALASRIGIPVEDCIRYSRKFSAENIDSRILYLSTERLLSEDFYRKLDEMLVSLEDFEEFVRDTVFKDTKKGTTLNDFLRSVMERTKALISKGADIDRVQEKYSGFVIRNSKVSPQAEFKITLVQLPPSLDKHDVESSARRRVYDTILTLFSEDLGIPEEDITRYIDLSDVRVYVTIRVFK